MMEQSRQGMPQARSRQACAERRWRLAALLLVLSVFSIGCNPLMLGYLFVTNTNMPPDFEEIVKKRDAKVVVVSNFATTEVRPELLNLDTQLGDTVATALRDRFKQNGDRVNIVPPYQVRNYLMTNRAGALEKMVAVGKHFKADYVIALEIHNDTNLSLFEPGSSRMLYRGIGEVSITVFDMSKQAEEAVVWTKEMRWTYPATRGPVPADTFGSSHTFRTAFVRRMAKDLTMCFAGYPTDFKNDCEN